VSRLNTFFRISLLSIFMTGCFNPPFNDFRDAVQTDPSAISPFTLRARLIEKLRREDIQFIRYGDQYTLIVPTDHYFVFNSAQLNDICYPGLNDLAALIKTYHYDKIYVAAFTDDIGTDQHKDQLSNARAQTMLTFLWAKRILAERLVAEGYGDEHDIGDNRFIHSSAYNRRIEIQWTETQKVARERSPQKLSPAQMTK
jgi:outer membrane protein OmpA-like peptidoglycan-associated protein